MDPKVTAFVRAMATHILALRSFVTSGTARCMRLAISRRQDKWEKSTLDVFENFSYHIDRNNLER